MTTSSSLFGKSPGPYTPNSVLSSSSTGNYDTSPALPASQLSYLDNLYSSVQGQINSKQDIMVNEVNIKSLNGVNLVTNGDFNSADFDALLPGVVIPYFPLLTSGEPTPTIAPEPQFGLFPPGPDDKWRVAGYTQLNIEDQPNIFGNLGYASLGFGTRRADVKATFTNSGEYDDGVGYMYPGTMICPTDGHYVCANRKELFVSHDFGETWQTGVQAGVDVAALLAYVNTFVGVFERGGVMYIYGTTPLHLIRSTDRGYTWSPFDFEPFMDAAGLNASKLGEMFNPVVLNSGGNWNYAKSKLHIEETNEVLYIREEPDFTYLTPGGAPMQICKITQGTPGILHYSNNGGLTYTGSKQLPYWDSYKNESLGTEYGPMTYFLGFYVFSSYDRFLGKVKFFATKDFVSWIFLSTMELADNGAPILKFLKSKNRLYILPAPSSYAPEFAYVSTDNLVSLNYQICYDVSLVSALNRVEIMDDRLCVVVDNNSTTTFQIVELRCFVTADNAKLITKEIERPFAHSKDPTTLRNYYSNTLVKMDNNKGVFWFIAWDDTGGGNAGSPNVQAENLYILCSQPLSPRTQSTAYGYTIPKMWYGNATGTCNLTYVVKEKP